MHDTQNTISCERIALSPSGPLPTDLPFTVDQARQQGVGKAELFDLLQRHEIRRMCRSVYVSADQADTIELRARALSLVVPQSAVVTDRTAAWLHGVAILPRSALAKAPKISIYQRSGTRVRRPGVEGGTRQMLDRDVMVVGGVQVTSPLRTALDLGRLLWRFDALAALDGFLRIGVPHNDMLLDSERFRGFRRVVQLRTLLPLADGRAESPAESALRLHWYDAGLPRPELQWWIHDDEGNPIYRLDLALPELKYCAEFDGQQFHSGEVQVQRDLRRRDWLAQERDWIIEPFHSESVYGQCPEAPSRLAAGYRRALNRSWG